jgi:hypothetical protein
MLTVMHLCIAVHQSSDQTFVSSKDEAGVLLLPDVVLITPGSSFMITHAYISARWYHNKRRCINSLTRCAVRCRPARFTQIFMPCCATIAVAHPLYSICDEKGWKTSNKPVLSLEPLWSMACPLIMIVYRIARILHALVYWYSNLTFTLVY